MNVTISFDNNGNLQLDDTSRQQIEGLMHQVFGSADQEEMKYFGAEIAVVVNTVADYMEFGRQLLTPLEIGLTEDIKLIKERYDVQAFQTSVDGRPYITRAGYLTDRFSYDEYECSFEVGWDDLRAAPFDIVAQKIKRAGEELAKKRDTAIRSVIATAAASVTGHNPTAASYLTKAACDNIFKLAAQVGTPIRRVLVNAGTVLDMRTSSFTTWPFVIAPDDARTLMRKGFIGEYGEAEWIASHSVPANKVYFVADPSNVGLTVRKGGLENATDINIYKKTNVYLYWEKRANCVFNPYGIWELTIT